jgi:hypothetical protein
VQICKENHCKKIVQVIVLAIFLGHISKEIFFLDRPENNRLDDVGYKRDANMI